jgi:Mn-dependent DtxR family transcriptional regulator
VRDTLKAYLRIIPSASAEMMAQELGLPHREVQEMLHQMDDDGDVILRSGWYRLSEAAKMRLGDAPEER